MKGRVLIIAGSDPSGGAGVQADIKTVTACGAYAAAAITSLTVQNTMGVRSIHPVPPDVIRDQIIAVLEDIGADAIKIGMIGGAAAGEAILDALESARAQAPLILDPVLAATSGDSLSEASLTDFIRAEFLPRTYLATPNLGEAEALTRLRIADAVGQKAAAKALLDLGAKAALVKGGHLPGDEAVDLLATHTEDMTFRNPRIASTSTHGTGCTLASAIAARVAQGAPLALAVEDAIAYVRDAIRTAPGLGKGCGPLNHAHVLSKKT